MTNIKIFYHQYHTNKYEKSPFSIDTVGYEPISLNSYITEKKIYDDCPSWRHKSKRTFLIRSPFDIDFFVDVSTGYISSNLSSQNLFNDIFSTHLNEKHPVKWYTDHSATVQLESPRFLFWTENKNIWIEQRSYSLTSYKNNFCAVGGWFNISSWQRPLSLAVDVVDVSKPVSIKRGDVIYEISFYSKNQEDYFILNKKEPPQKLINKVESNLSVKNFVRGLSGKIALKNKESRCPFHFLQK